MVGAGVLMLALVGLSLWLRAEGSTTTWFQLAGWSAPLGFVAVIAGWVTRRRTSTWVVYGLMHRTRSRRR